MAIDQFPKSFKHQKKALLIGISYEENEENETLDGSHKGVLELRRMLIKQYGYAHEDIVVMLDSRLVPTRLWPTYDNILRQIDALVQGAQAGDHFFFAYSGHSSQVTNRNNSEEDGQDEVIISSDGRDLIDNELKVHLVDPLPVGSTLVAVLDTCHSGTLLDLKHHRCNRVYTPRISKGYRKTDIRWNANVRRDAMHRSMAPAAFHERSSLSPLRQRQIVTADRSLWLQHRDGGNARKTEPRSRFRDRRPIDSRSWPLKLSVIPTISSVGLPIVQCESPIALWECEGDCRSKGIQGPEAAHVVCISACKDEQRAWEGPAGASIIMDFIHILRQDAHPSLKDLMIRLTHLTHERCLEIHDFTRQYKRGRRTESFCGEMDNFQDPQIASHIPLNMDELFAL